MAWAIAALVLVLTLGGAALGRRYAASLRPEHLGEESKHVVKATTGVIATLAALVLGLVTASAKSGFDEADAGVRKMATDIVALDRTLARYGPETRAIRDGVTAAIGARLERNWPPIPAASSDAIREMTAGGESVEEQIVALAPANQAQAYFKEQALEAIGDLLQTRWGVLMASGRSLQIPFLTVLVLWLVLLFASFGLYSRGNRLAPLSIAACSLSVSSAIFLILELDMPFSGIIQLSDAPLRFALASLAP